MSRRLFEKLAYGQRQTARFNEALGRMGLGAGSYGTDALSRTEHAQALQSVNYGTGWRDLAQHYGGGARAPGQADLSRMFDLRRGLLDTPLTTPRFSQDRQMMSPAARLTLSRSGAQAYGPFIPDTRSAVPADVQRGRFLEQTPAKRFTFVPDQITKIKAGLSPSARPVVDPPPLRGGVSGISLTKAAPKIGPADNPSRRLWRGSEPILRPANPMAPTWASGHFDVASLYAPSVGDRITGYRSNGITTGHFTPQWQADTRHITHRDAVMSRAKYPENSFFERVVNSRDLSPARIESQYVRGTEGLYHRGGTNFFPTQSAVPHNFPQAPVPKAPLAQVTETPGMGSRLMDAGKRLAGKVGPWLKRFHR